MRARGGQRLRGALLAAVLVALVVPASASAHAALLRTVPSATGTVNVPPGAVHLTYSEPVEPKFAIVSVTEAAGHQRAAGPPRRDPADPDRLVTPVRHLGEGWYLVFWRVISADGHPVRGAFTFAVGPNPGPAPQFAIPSTSETATTVPLLVARWAAFLTVMVAVGLFVLRAFVARPAPRLVPGSSLRAVSVAFAVAGGLALVAIPVYLVLATAQFALRSATDLGALLPLVRASAFGRALLDLEIVAALFLVAGAIAIRLDRTDRPQRSSAALIALVGAAIAAAALLLVPGLGGHASQTGPRAGALAADWSHLVAGSVWLGGLVGLLVLWGSTGRKLRVSVLGRVVPRFSRVAFAAVVVLAASGTGASILHLPTLATLWDTSYGKWILVKIGLLIVALVLAGVNLARSKPRLEAAVARRDPALGSGAAGLLRRMVGGEVGLVVVAVFAAAVLSSLPPPSKALAGVGQVSARVGPGQVVQVVHHGPYRLALRIAPNRAAFPNSFALDITKDGVPVRGAAVTTNFAMLDMEMGQLGYTLREQSPGSYVRQAPALVMAGHWALRFEVAPPGDAPFEVTIVDTASG